MGTAVNNAIAELVRLGNTVDVKARIRKMVAAEGAGERFVTKVLGKELGL